MVNRKQRLVKNLYNATPAPSQPQVSSILQGSFRMQGPVDESDHEVRANMMPVPTEKEYSSCSENSKYHHKPDSGTCNACSAPSSSCSHNQILMASKVDECSGEASSENALSYSVNDAIPINKGVHSETAPKPGTRNFASGSSSNTSENVDCEGSCRNSDLSATSEIVTVLPKLEDLKAEGDHGDHQSRITGIADSRMSHFSLSNGDNAVSSNYPVSANTSSAQESVSMAPLQTNPESFDVRCKITESENSSKRQRVKSEDNLKEVPLPVSSSAGLSSQNPGLFESRSDTVEGANPRSNAEDNLLHIALLKNSNGDGSSSPKGEDFVNIQTDPIAKNLEVVKNEGSENASLSNVKENHLESPPMEEDDDSDLVLHDVKVCDICGDAGREDLLAICSRCSDGAEHTYCMREMLDKVPSGDWLCEECQFGVQIKGRNQDTVDIVEGSAKMNSSGQANSESSSGNKKSLAKVSDVDESRNGNGPTSKILGKRWSDDVEVSIPAKRRIRESDKGSVNLSTSSVVPAISRNSSFKQDRLKTKTNQHTSSSSLLPPESANCSASASRPHTQGSFIKSNSFNSLSVKPKVNRLDDVVPQKQRSVRDSATLDRKEGALRSIRKSVSFKSPNMSRFNPGESKVKLLSHVPDIKGSKNSKDRTIYERKNSFQSERLPISNSAVPGAKNDQKLVSSVETNSLNSPRKFRDVKAVPSDARPTPLSRSSSFAARKGSEPSVSQGEGKRQSTTSMVGVPFKNTDNNQFAKPNIEKIKASAGQISADRPFSNANESFPDSLSQQKESVDFGEKVNDSSSGRSKQSREGLDSKDKLKAAIEAAVLKKPGIYRKHRHPDQGSDTSLAGINSEIVGQVLLSDSNIKGNVPILSEMKEDHMALEIADDDVKQFPVVSSEGASLKPEESCLVVPLEGVSLGSNGASHVSEGISTFCERLAIPDIEHMWKGVFEVHRVGRTMNLFDGIQAHLSACASPKVLEAVNKFDQKVILNEVPRLTTWPVQFQENGVREENIAVFFFAKDSNSYEKSYKVLLNNMMKNDVALCGNFDGFELLIFPSNQLPEKTQRWNTLFFMWGVFRGKRVNKHVLGSDEQTSVPQGVPTASMLFPFYRSADMQGDRSIVAGSIGSPASEIRTSELTSSSSGEELKEVCIGRVSSDVMNIDPVRTEQLSDNRLNLRSFSPVHSSAAKSCGETADNDNRLRHSIISQEEKGHGGSGYKTEPELEVCADRGCVSNESQQIPVNCGPDLNSPHSSCGASAHEMGSVGIEGEVGKMDRMEYEARARDGFRHTSAPGCGTEMLKEHAKVASDSISQKEAWISPKDIAVEQVRTREKQKNDFYGLEGGNGLLPHPTNGNAGRLLGGDYGGSRDDFSGERFFFPVVPLPEEELGRRVEVKMSGEEEQFEKKAPNLELALWGGKDELNLNLEAEEAEAEAEAGSKGGEENDLSSASLSLSLSFPFPEAEPRLSRSSEEEASGDVNTSLLLFGVEGGDRDRVI